MQRDTRVPSPQHEQLSALHNVAEQRSKVTLSNTSKNNHHSSNTKSPNTTSSDREKSYSHDSSSASKEKGKGVGQNDSSVGTSKTSTPAKEDEDIHFRRQHFDRNSILRTSKKRSRKASLNASATAGNPSTPGKVADTNLNSSPQKEQARETTPNNRRSSSGWAAPPVINNSTSNSSVSTSKENQSNRVLTDKKTNITKEVNALYRENMKNIENRTTFGTGDQKYISNKQNQYKKDDDLMEKSYKSINDYCDNENESRIESNRKIEPELPKKLSFDEIDSQAHNGSNNVNHQNNQNARNNNHPIADERISEVRMTTFSASDNVAALLGKPNTNRTNFVPTNNITTTPQTNVQQKDVPINSKSKNIIKSNGIKEIATPSGGTVIRTRREALRQAEEEAAAKNSGKTPTRRQNSSNNGNDNNRGINTQPSKKNEKQDRITQEEDCGRLI